MSPRTNMSDTRNPLVQERMPNFHRGNPEVSRDSPSRKPIPASMATITFYWRPSSRLPLRCDEVTATGIFWGEHPEQQDAVSSRPRAKGGKHAWAFIRLPFYVRSYAKRLTSEFPGEGPDVE